MWEKKIWPPSLPDCNPLDYFVWGITEIQVNKVPHNTADSLINKIKEVMVNLDRDTMARGCKQFRSKLELWWRLMAISSNKIVPKTFIYYFFTVIKLYIF